MGRKPDDPDELLARAKANGYRRGEHRENDAVPDRHAHIDKTIYDQDGALRRYVVWKLDEMREDAARRGVPAPDERAVKECYLSKGVEVPDMAVVKDFLRFQACTMCSKIEEKLTDEFFNSFTEWFFGGFTRVTGTVIGKTERSEVYNWVRRTLTAEGVVVHLNKPQDNYTKRDLDRVFQTLWDEDDLIFTLEYYRACFTLIVLLYCETGARLSAFFKGGLALPEKDIKLALQRVGGDRWRPIYKISQRWVKNNRHPGTVYFDAAGKDHGKFIYNRAGMLLVLAISDSALFGFRSLDNLRKQEIPPGQDELILRFNDDALDRFVFRR